MSVIKKHRDLIEGLLLTLRKRDKIRPYKLKEIRK